MLKCILSAIALLFAWNSAQAEIQSVTITWKALKCEAACLGLLEREFNKIQGVSNVLLNQQQGMAVLSWKDNVQFSSVSVKTAMKMVGLSWRSIRVKVKGKIQHKGDQLFIISEGDKTSFELINPVVPEPNRQTTEYNKQARAVRPELKNQLLAAEKGDKFVVIEGPLFMPQRSPELILTIESLNILSPESSR